MVKGLVSQAGAVLLGRAATSNASGRGPGDCAGTVAPRAGGARPGKIVTDLAVALALGGLRALDYARCVPTSDCSAALCLMRAG